MKADTDANQDDYTVSKQDQTARANTITDDDIKRWIELFKNVGWRTGKTRCLRCVHKVNFEHRQLWRACDGVCICCNNKREGGHEGQVCPIMRENPEFLNGDFWKQRTDTQTGQAPKDLDGKQFTKHRGRILSNKLLTPVAVAGAYSYSPFPYIPAPFLQSASENPYFSPPPGYYSGYSPAVGYYCLAYPIGNAPQIPVYGATYFVNPKLAIDNNATMNGAMNQDKSAALRQHKRPRKSMRLRLGLKRNGEPKDHGEGDDA
jgi:hypothetical protein